MVDDTPKTHSWGTISAIVFLLAVIVGLIYYYYVSNNLIAAVCLVILIGGIYMVISALMRSTAKDQWGTSESGAAALFGFLMLAVGGAGMIYVFADGFVLPLIYAILMIVLYLIYALAMKRKA
ncbi:hypothetical protein AUP07_0733 [methanogenic archaeon mixed culture ISO4-G1]|nr:hypothetical protein AUP07_0733 [methanogenic archaeon mixed culture ISO4-G1]